MIEHPPSVARITPTRPDVEIASEIKFRAEALLLQLCALMDETQRAGLQLNFAIQRVPDPTQRAYIAALTVSKFL